MLKIEELELRFLHTILERLSLTVESGEITGIVGPSGGGKSSLLKIIAGLLDADKGSVSWNGKQVKGPRDVLIPGHADIQLVNQDFGLDHYHTVEQNVVQKMLYLPNDVRARFCSELLELVDLTALANRQAVHLSGGEQQRLAIIRALAAEPDLLLLDEPFAHLDAHLKERIGNYLRMLSETRGTTCILVSHEGQDVLQWSARIHFMHEGKIVRTDSPQAFYFNPSSAYEALFFGEINTCVVGSATVLFRPVEYAIAEAGEGIEVNFERAAFAGAYWRNFVCTTGGEALVLFAHQSLEHVRAITIRKHQSQAWLERTRAGH